MSGEKITLSVHEDIGEKGIFAKISMQTVVKIFCNDFWQGLHILQLRNDNAFHFVGAVSFQKGDLCWQVEHINQEDRQKVQRLAEILLDH